ncbi:hypothetical protein Cni_G10206 [Canna indica]|uniref:Uncharacterized protein n=1 Tax=Canna indica TaxID=4628 RepID=A0AAQ3K5Q7_9LILI|nr:hypothetical protein Cni_G10206 [Canna indica]
MVKTSYGFHCTKRNMGIGTHGRKKKGAKARTIYNSMKEVRERMRKCIGDGKDIELWWDPWLSEIPLNIWPTYINNSELIKYEKVNELVNGSDWNWITVDKCFEQC